MKFAHFAKAIAPLAAVVMVAALSGCNGSVSIDGEKGKKLADLDLSGAAPDGLVLASPDEVHVSQGDKLTITVDGDPETVDKLRFTLKKGSLGVMREHGFSWHDGDKIAVVNVTMPAPKEVTLAGSGKITVPSLAKDAKVTIAGSGDVDTNAINSDKLELTIAGSGNFHGAGNVHDLELTVAGSGSAATDALRVDSAKVTIAGSGDAAFASDGTVEATIMGSGEVRVKGRAHCTVSAMGSGKLVCEPGDGQGVKSAKDQPPSPPPAPSAPNTDD